MPTSPVQANPFDLIFNNMTSAIIITDIAGHLQSMNHRFCELFGYTQQELLHKSMFDCIHPADRSAARHRVSQLGQNEISQYRTQLRYYRKDQSVFWADATVLLMNNGPDAQPFIMALIYDITEQQSTKDSLLESQAIIDSFLKSTSDPVLILSYSSNLILFNQGYLDLWNFSASQLPLLSRQERWTHIGKQLENPQDFIHEVAFLYHHSDACSSGQIKTKQNQFYEWDSNPYIIDGTIAGRLWKFHDITVRKLAEIKLARMNEELEKALKRSNHLTQVAEQANQAKSRFLASMSHEIRTPLNAILGMTEIALQSSPTAEQADYLETIQQSGQHLLEIITDILDFSKIEAGEMTLSAIDFDLHDLLEQTLKILQPATQKKKLYLDLFIDPLIPRRVKGDPSRIKQILFNLLGNAIKFTHQGGIKLSLHFIQLLMSQTSPSQIELEFSITDTGIGIDQEKFPLIFQQFIQADTSISRRYGGTGLGLSITKALVHLMQGNINVTSSPNQGSTFTFTIRLELGEMHQHIKPPDSDLDWTQKSEKPLHILLAEDNVVNAKIAQLVLTRQKHSLKLAQNGLEALNYLESECFDLVLMDVEMPEMDGIEATYRLRQGQAGNLNLNVPIMAMTAHATADIQEKCLAAGMNGYLTKPLNLAELTHVLQRIPRQ